MKNQKLTMVLLTICVALLVAWCAVQQHRIRLMTAHFLEHEKQTLALIDATTSSLGLVSEKLSHKDVLIELRVKNIETRLLHIEESVGIDEPESDKNGDM